MLLRCCFCLLLAWLAPVRPVGAQVSASAATPYTVAKGVTVQHWTQADGLPVGGVTALHLDEQGFLWAATLGGLVRFDGLAFRVYEAVDHPGIPNNRMQGLLSSERFFIPRTEANDLLYGDGERFVNLSEAYEIGPSPEQFAVPGGAVWAFAGTQVYEVRYGPEVQPVTLREQTDLTPLLTTDRSRLIQARDAIIRYDSSGHGTRFPMPSALGISYIRDVAQDPKGRLLMAIEGGVAVLDAAGVRLLPITDRLPDEDPIVYKLLPTKDRLYGLTQTGWFVIEGNTLTKKDGDHTLPFVRARPTVTSPAFDTYGNAWMPGDSLLLRNGQLAFRVADRIRDILEDPDGGLWVATDASGLFRLAPTPLQMTGMLPEGGHNAYGVYPTEEGMWVGLLDAGQFALFSDDTVVRRVVMDLPWAMGQGPDGDTWLGGAHLCRLTPTTCVRETDPLPSIVVIHTDQQGRFWIGGPDGLFVRDTPADTWREVRLSPARGLWVRSMVERPDGSLLMATFGTGLVIYENDRPRAWNTDAGFPSDHLRSLYEDPGGVLYVGSGDRGLIRLAIQPGQPVEQWPLVNLTREEGLLDNAIHAIVPDDQQRLWMNTNRGIFRVHTADLDAFARGQRARLRPVVYDERDGLLNREGNGGIHAAGYRGTDGRIRFPTQQGVAVIDPARSADPALPTIRAEHLVIDGVQRPMPEAGEAITLPPGTQSVRVLFAAPHFYKPEDLRYRYRLVGYSEAWIESGAEKQAVLTNIPPGTYQLALQAGNGYQWAAQSTVLSITQQPTFFQTGWFYLLLSGGLGGLLLLTVGLRTRLIQQRNAELEQAVRDRTEQINEQMKRLATLDEMKTRFFENVSHDLRTPLTLIRGPVSDLLARQNGALPPDIRAQVERIDAGADRLLRLVNQILDLVAAEAKALQLQAEPLDLTAFLAAQVGAFQSAAADQSVELQFTADEAPSWVEGDLSKLEMIFQNLLSNALKFTPAGGQILVSLQAEPSAWVVTVADTGCGIAPDDLDQIFDRFYQVGTSPTGGSGIGLSVVSELVALHGGRVSAESTPGTGSTFRVTLPRIPAPKAVPEAMPDAQPIDRPTPPNGAAASADDAATILVVEDNQDLRRYIASILAERFAVRLTEHGAAGLAAAREEIPDLIITDLMMPEMDGLTFCDHIKTDVATSHIPVLMLTARADTSSLVGSLGHGADVFLTKPFDQAALLAYIDSLLANRQRIQQALSHSAAPLTLATPDLSSVDADFLARVQEIVAEQLSDTQFTTQWLADEVGLSSRQFLRKMEALTGEKPGAMLQRIRMERAAEMLQQDAGSVKEIAFAVGYRSESSFRRVFKKHFGKAPTAFSE